VSGSAAADDELTAALSADPRSGYARLLSPSGSMQDGLSETHAWQRGRPTGGVASAR